VGRRRAERCGPTPTWTSWWEFLPDRKIGWEFFELEEELTRELARKVDLGSKRSLKPWVRANALRDARIIYAA